MLRLVSLLYWKVSVSAALESFVSCPKRICAWWADVADIAGSVTFSDGNVSAVSRPLHTFSWNPLVTVLGVQEHPLSPTHIDKKVLCYHDLSVTHTYTQKYTHAQALHFHTKLNLIINYSYRPTLVSYLFSLRNADMLYRQQDWRWHWER